MENKDIEKIINICLVIPMGLPGSGKTHYMHQHYIDNFKTTHLIINFDDYIGQEKSITKILTQRFKYISNTQCTTWLQNGYTDMYLDGLWLTMDKVGKLIDDVVSVISNWHYEYNCYLEPECNIIFKVNAIKIIHFDENRQYCLNNDRCRRELSSRITIEKAPFDNIITEDFIKSIKQKYNIDDMSVINMQIHKSTLWEIAFAGNELKSQNWLIAGQWGDYTGAGGDITPDKPKLFDEFDEFLLRLCPNIGLQDYKVLFKETCSIKEKTESQGYYGAWETNAYWQCDLEKLYKMMLEKKLISEYL